MTNERFIELLEEAGCRVYSHRAYSGDYCIGAITEGDDADMLSDILTCCDTKKERAEVAGIFKNIRTDNLGRKTIVYFPAMKMEDTAQ